MNKETTASKKLRQLFFYVFLLLCFLFSLDYVLPKQQRIITILWLKIEKTGHIKRKIHCLVKYSNGNNKSGKWTEKKINHSFCKHLIPGETYRLEQSLIFRSWKNITHINKQ